MSKDVPGEMIPETMNGRQIMLDCACCGLLARLFANASGHLVICDRCGIQRPRKFEEPTHDCRHCREKSKP